MLNEIRNEKKTGQQFNYDLILDKEKYFRFNF